MSYTNAPFSTPVQDIALSNNAIYITSNLEINSQLPYNSNSMVWNSNGTCFIDQTPLGSVYYQSSNSTQNFYNGSTTTNNNGIFYIYPTTTNTSNGQSYFPVKISSVSLTPISSNGLMTAQISSISPNNNVISCQVYQVASTSGLLGLGVIYNNNAANIPILYNVSGW